MADSQSHFHNYRGRHRIQGLQDPKLEVEPLGGKTYEIAPIAGEAHDERYAPRPVSESEILAGSIEAAELYLDSENVRRGLTHGPDSQPGL